MSNGIVAKRYAVALFQLAKEQNTIAQFEKELNIVKEVFTTNKELIDVLKHPKVTNEAKKTIIKESFASLSPQVLNTLLLLVERHRVDIVTEVVNHFIQSANEASGIEDAVVYSVRPLTDAELTSISTSFAKKIGKTSLRLQNVVDKALLGGLKLRIGNRIYDGSISGKLERIERQLVANRL
ncbi:F0F1 ATP synthase subunit delta [Metabacillus sediminilitoris]|uniref:ATP synthase subunit delta n=1 Tax=Metabacillus sediminilitoris TaxID=2567941 RepID=A0A4V3WEM8_9BACI|nr:F0F1 ATP synthase subunit delta [Metabacillus sediminilitoris]QGQ48335.1 F0F1 ATP synthase subunit delta [Metabacillus sediminilitoris]THF76991.1 F0F1 ATP synthase subunit delta [Metabacillus sediminilitoris]